MNLFPKYTFKVETEMPSEEIQRVFEDNVTPPEILAEYSRSKKKYIGTFSPQAFSIKRLELVKSRQSIFPPTIVGTITNTMRGSVISVTVEANKVSYICFIAFVILLFIAIGVQTLLNTPSAGASHSNSPYLFALGLIGIFAVFSIMRWFSYTAEINITKTFMTDAFVKTDV